MDVLKKAVKEEKSVRETLEVSTQHLPTGFHEASNDMRVFHHRISSVVTHNNISSFLWARVHMFDVNTIHSCVYLCNICVIHVYICVISVLRLLYSFE